MALLTRDSILARAARLTREEPSEFFGGSLLLRELSRVDYRIAATAAQGTGDLSNELWWAALFAAGVIGADGEPMFGTDEVLAWKKDADLWNEIIRVADLVLHLSEVGADALTKSGAEPDTGRGPGRGRRQRKERGPTPGDGTP